MEIRRLTLPDGTAIECDYQEGRILLQLSPPRATYQLTAHEALCLAWDLEQRAALAITHAVTTGRELLRGAAGEGVP